MSNRHVKLELLEKDYRTIRSDLDLALVELYANTVLQKESACRLQEAVNHLKDNFHQVKVGSK